MVYCQLPQLVVPTEFNLLSDNIMDNMDEKSKLSLNGCRVTDMILQLVPNIENFRITLYAIKFWAKSILHFIILYF